MLNFFEILSLKMTASLPVLLHLKFACSKLKTLSTHHQRIYIFIFTVFMEKVCNHLPSGKTCRIFRYDVVSRIIEALSNCDVMALGSGRSFASSRNSAFSFSRRDRAAFLLFSFMAQRANKPRELEEEESSSYV